MTDESQLPEVGPWAEDKHARVRAYVDLAAKAVGKNFVGQGKGGFFYIDPFCGAGRARMKDTDRVIEGSPLVAAAAARAAGAPFTRMYIADIKQGYVEQCAARLRERGEIVRTYVGPASGTSAEIARDLPPHGLHFAFLDPFNLEALPFEVIRRFASFKRMDILVHFSAMDLQRNFDEFLRIDESALDSFAPGWRSKVPVQMGKREQRHNAREHWEALMAEVGLPTAGRIELIRGTKNQPLYWLIFAAKSDLVRIPRKPVTDSIPSRSRFHGKPVGGGGRVEDGSVAGLGQSVWLLLGSLAGGSLGVVGPRRARIDSPLRTMRWALWTRRSSMASASVGSPR